MQIRVLEDRCQKDSQGCFGSVGSELVGFGYMNGSTWATYCRDCIGVEQRTNQVRGGSVDPLSQGVVSSPPQAYFRDNTPSTTTVIDGLPFNFSQAF